MIDIRDAVSVRHLGQLYQLGIYGFHKKNGLVRVQKELDRFWNQLMRERALNRKIINHSSHHCRVLQFHLIFLAPVEWLFHIYYRGQNPISLLNQMIVLYGIYQTKQLWSLKLAGLVWLKFLISEEDAGVTKIFLFLNSTLPTLRC